MTRILICLAVFAFVPTVANADLVGFTDTFANASGSPGTSNPADWTIVSGNTTFLLESGDADDGALLDTADDGYASLNGNVTANGGNFNPTVRRDFGVVTAADVGSIIDLDISFLEVSVGANVIGGIESNGSFVAQESGGTFGANPNNGQLAISYTVDAADVGSTLSTRFQFFSSQDARVIGLDTVDLRITAVPEPSALFIIAGVAALGCVVRRRN